MDLTPRERILEATLTCVGRYGLAKTTVEDVAREAGCSRATVYRYFPGGREQLVGDVIAWEAGRFFGRLAEAVSGAADLRSLVEEGLVFSHHAVLSHEVLQKVLQTEPDRLLPTLTVEAGRLLGFVRAFLVPYVEREADRLRPGVSVADAADWLARHLLSFTSAAGSWDLHDRADVRRLVDRLLAGVLEPPAATGLRDGAGAPRQP